MIGKKEERSIMCIGRATERFLEDEGVRAVQVELDCLNSCILEAYSEGQSDIYVCIPRAGSHRGTNV